MRLRTSLLLVVAALALSSAGVATARPDSAPGFARGATLDSDGDGIPNRIERKPAYRAAGGSARHKDVWVECDFMRGLEPARGMAGHVVRAFRAAPLENPDGLTGVSLHLDIDEELKFETQWGDVTTQSGYLKTYSKLKTARANKLDGDPRYYHYCVFINQLSAVKTSGVSMDSTNPGGGIPGDMFAVALGGPWGEDGERAEFQAGTLMHELGHNLGLAHGGGAAGFDDTHTNYKPNYLSVMNGDFQFGFYAESEGGEAVRQVYFDYSRWRANTLDRNSLDEERGVTAPPAVAQEWLGAYRCPRKSAKVFFRFNEPIDWDCDGTIRKGSVDVDRGPDGVVLRGHNDWRNLAWDGGAIGDGEAKLTPRAPRDELTPAMKRRRPPTSLRGG